MNCQYTLRYPFEFRFHRTPPCLTLGKFAGVCLIVGLQFSTFKDQQMLCAVLDVELRRYGGGTESRNDTA